MQGKSPLRTLAVGLSTLAILAACGQAGSTATSSALTSGGSSAAPSGLSWFSSAAVPYKGAEIRVVGEDVAPTTVMSDLSSQFTGLTGIKVTVEKYPFADLMQKVNLDVQAQQGTYDVISIPYTELGRMAANKQVKPLSSCLSDPKLTFPSFSESDILKGMWQTDSYYKGEVYGYPSNAAVLMMAYRKDLFDNSAEKAAFKAKYGYELAVPTTWQQYHDVAAFFDRKAGDKLAGKTLDRAFYGVGVEGKRHKAMVEEWLTYVWSFGGDVVTADGKVVVNQPATVDATKYFLSLFQYAPPGAKDWTWDEMTTGFQQSQIAEGLQWSDTIPVLEDKTQSKTAGLIGWAIAPSQDKKASSFGGYTYAVPADTKNFQAACLWMQWAASKEVDLQRAQKGIAPIRASVYDDPSVSAQPGFAALKEALANANGLPKLTQFAQIDDGIAARLSDAVTGQTTAEDALQKLQANLEKILSGS